MHGTHTAWPPCSRWRAFVVIHYVHADMRALTHFPADVGGQAVC
jgi:hypothetical protein